MRYFNLKIRIVSGLFILLSSSLIPAVNAFAVLNEATLQSYGITQYDPNFVECATSDTSGAAANSTTKSVKITDTPTLKTIFTSLIAGGMSSVQASAVMGNMYWESGFNPDKHEIGNDIGYGLVQWSFGRRTNLEHYTTTKGVPTSDLATQIAYIFVEYNGSYKQQLAGTAFATGTDIPKATEAWMRIYEAPGLTPANDPARLNTERIPAALQVYSFYSSLGPASAVGSVTTTDCGSGNGVVAGSIVQTALNLALQSPANSYNYPESSPTGPGTDKADARDTYQVAKPTYNPGAAWSDCGGFIATVMRSSGADPNYALLGVGSQVAYVKSHPEKYTIITNPTVSDLQPGDILLSQSVGHTIMYVGPTVINGVTYTDVDASLGQRVPSVRNSGSHLWMLSNGAIIARFKK